VEEHVIQPTAACLGDDSLDETTSVSAAAVGRKHVEALQRTGAAEPPGAGRAFEDGQKDHPDRNVPIGREPGGVRAAMRVEPASERVEERATFAVGCFSELIDPPRPTQAGEHRAVAVAGGANGQGIQALEVAVARSRSRIGVVARSTHVSAMAIAPSVTARSATGVMHAAVNSGWWFTAGKQLSPSIG
jgi:hypothetical protein